MKELEMPDNPGNSKLTLLIQKGNQLSAYYGRLFEIREMCGIINREKLNMQYFSQGIA
jgi:hypothetical protein